MAKQTPRTAQLIGILKTWCKEKHGRQEQAAKILGVGGSSLRDWLSGRRRPTSEQTLGLIAFLQTVSTYGPPVEEPPKGSDPLSALHRGLESPDKKNVWIRKHVGSFHHIILGGPNRDAALKQIEAFLRKGN
jgi:transcriptional regulator with XRE-family HTH domain